ncbi:MAG: SIR2 family protein [Myxococcota bacterium]
MSDGEPQPFHETKEWTALRTLIRRGQNNPADRPILWVGAGLSIAAGYKSTQQLVNTLAEASLVPLPRYDPHAAPNDVRVIRNYDGWVDLFCRENSPGELVGPLSRAFGADHPPTPMHRRLMSIPWHSVITTNYDLTLEKALSELGLPHVPVTLEQNIELVDDERLRVVHIHGSVNDMANAVFSSRSYDEFATKHAIPDSRLSIELLQRPVVFMGCSMTDRRILELMRSYRTHGMIDRRRFTACIMTEGDWGYLSDDQRAFLTDCHIRPILLQSHNELPGAVARLAPELAAVPAYELHPIKEELRALEDIVFGQLGPLVLRLVGELWASPLLRSRESSVSETLAELGGRRLTRAFGALFFPVERPLFEILQQRLELHASSDGGTDPLSRKDLLAAAIATAERLSERLQNLRLTRAFAERHGWNAKAASTDLAASADGEAREDEVSQLSLVLGLIFLCTSTLPPLSRDNAETLIHQPEDTLASLEQRLSNIAKLTEVGGSRGYKNTQTTYLEAFENKHGGVGLINSRLDDPLRTLPVSQVFVPPRCQVWATSSTHLEPKEIEAGNLLEHCRNRELVVVFADAGFGKTTLLQWLSIRAMGFTDADRERSDQRKLVPFLVQLRFFAETDFPRLADLGTTLGLEPTKELRAWTAAVFEEGSGLILLDGLDELPKERRKAFATWLRELRGEVEALAPKRSSRSEDGGAGRPPIVLTLRPSAEASMQGTLRQFPHVELQRLERGQIFTLIKRWHAAISLLVESAAKSNVRAAHQRLVAQLKSDSALAKLAANPLMCALLCSMNYLERGRLPTRDYELCKEGIRILLHDRDVKKEVPFSGDASPLRPILAERTLGSAAMWMQCENRISIHRSEMLEVIKERTALWDHENRRSPEEVLQHLLERSGIVREPGDGEIIFTHRLFQEYLAASRLMGDRIEQRGVKVLIDNSANDFWAKTITMAAAIAGANRGNKLVLGLLNKHGRLAKGTERARLGLLLIECASRLPEKLPAVQDGLRQIVKTYLPPADRETAKAIVQCGDLAVPLLAKKASHSESQKLGCASCLLDIGTRSAHEELLPYLRATDQEPHSGHYCTELSFLIGHQGHQGCKRLLNDLPLADLLTLPEVIRIALARASMDFRVARGLAWAHEYTTLELRDADIDEILGLDALENLERLDINGSSIRSLEGIAELKRLTYIDCSDTELSSDTIDELARLPRTVGILAIDTPGASAIPHAVTDNPVETG